MYLMMHPGKAWDTDRIYQKTHIAYFDIRVPKLNEHILLCSYKPIVRPIWQNIWIAVFNCKSDPQDQTDWSPSYGVPHKMYCATVLRAV